MEVRYILGYIDIPWLKRHLLVYMGFVHGCLESVDWTTGLEYWTGILDWNTGLEYWNGLNCCKKPFS